mmetsp:Transcript_23630/g.73203  ORF Transcript_23630/g.73203 Transcript_23630/m.73203 type:complete len:295 (-) Transcript_23630:540-1424(-)|eukprot:CAMPEP_0174832544 /NCGR_PEP_ID=MMETSP1114-20130205/3729_1 /TAXON_ID=312471 /ORGANISM="Neobodo designis, Strain CCAP 1951/1" /LENGTH=294 /DNA_ID=CAMNT_0016066405 /DNA_START=146 /DNA_END=1030 /DNA_ORIENTATION=-
MVFSVPTFTTVGDDYDAKPKDAKKKGLKTMLGSGPKSGNDATFDRFKSIHEGDPYVEPGVAERRARLEAAKKKLTPSGFRLASPPQKAPGLGTHFGTFDAKPIPHETDYVVPRKGEAPPRKQPAPRPMLTNPTKKGTFGVAGTLLSKEGTDYVADFYDSKREADRKDHERHKQLMKGAPWRGGGRRGYTFDEGPGTGASTCYKLTKPLEEKKVRESKAAVKGPDAPWRPGGKVPKRLPPVDYREDPYDGYDPRAGPKKKAETAPSGSRPAWRPNAAGKGDTWYTKSVAFHGLPD